MTSDIPRLTRNPKRSLPTRLEKDRAEIGDPNAFDDPNDPKQIGPWLIGDTVGRGATGRVRMAKHQTTGMMAAVKIIPFQNPFRVSRVERALLQNASIEREIVMMKLMDHPNIMRLYDVWEGRGCIFLILEWVEGGELFDLIVDKKQFQYREVVAYFKQIIYGLAYCHKFSIAHRDLKPENILVYGPKNQFVKIVDLGMAAFHLPYEAQLYTSCGSPHYVSPEVITGKPYDGHMADVWSAGVVLYVMLTRNVPFEGHDLVSLLKCVSEGKYDIPNNIPPDAADLLRRMLVVKVSDRITVKQILQHPFMKYESPGILRAPPPSLSHLQAPIKDVDCDILAELRIVHARHTSEPLLKHYLLSTEPNCSKAFYYLLLKFGQRRLETTLAGNWDHRRCDQDIRPYKASDSHLSSPLFNPELEHLLWYYSSRTRALYPHGHNEERHAKSIHPFVSVARSSYPPQLGLGWPSQPPYHPRHHAPAVQPVPIPTSIASAPRNPRIRDATPGAATNESPFPPKRTQAPLSPQHVHRLFPQGPGIIPRSPPLTCVAGSLEHSTIFRPNMLVPLDGLFSSPCPNPKPSVPVRRLTNHAEPIFSVCRPATREDILAPIDIPTKSIYDRSLPKLPTPSSEPRPMSRNSSCGGEFEVISTSDMPSSSFLHGSRLPAFLRSTKNGRQSLNAEIQSGKDKQDVPERTLKRKNKPANLDLRKAYSPASYGASSGAASSTSTLSLTPVIQEFREWVYNIFHSPQKTPFALCSPWDCDRARLETTHVLRRLNVRIFSARGGVLDCFKYDRFDEDGNHLQKYCRFRVEFFTYRVNESAPFTPIPGTQSLVSTINFIHEKGSYSTFQDICSMVKSEWIYEPLYQPVTKVYTVDHPPVVSGSSNGFLLVDHADKVSMYLK